MSKERKYVQIWSCHQWSLMFHRAHFLWTYGSEEQYSSVDPWFCVWVCKPFGSVGIGCLNKAALCLMNLSHKYQLVSCYTITAESCARRRYCVYLHIHCHIHSNAWRPHLAFSPGHFVLTPPLTHTNAQSLPPPVRVWCGVREQDGCNARQREITAPIFTSLSGRVWTDSQA